MIESLAQIYEKKINKSKLFEILINQNKESFVNLTNYNKNKENIIKDIYIQNFYIELLNKLFENEKNLNNKNFISNKIFPPKNSFIFNGYDSKMAFKLNKFYLDNSILFFSFQICNQINNNNCNYPLFVFENELNDEIIFKLYIKHIVNNDKSNNKLFIYHNKNNIILDKIEDISSNNNYFIALYFKNKKLSINVISVNNNKENKYHQEIDIKNNKDIQIKIKIGHNDVEKEYFKGYIGSFILIKNLSLQKDINYEDIVYNILGLKDFYKYFPYFFSKSTNYNFDNILLYHQVDNENLFLNKKNYLQKHIKEFECTFYLTPEIIETYKSLNDIHLSFIYLPDVPDICEIQHFYVILEMNISLTNFELIYIDFLTNNGFYYICLIYEYLYQFSNIYIANKNNLNFDSIDTKLQKIITNTISKTILILQNYSKCKYIINFEDSIKKLFRNFYECLKSLNKIWNILNNDILSNLYELVFSYKDDVILYQKKNKIENNHLINKIISFSDGLIDILFDIDLYKCYNEGKSLEDNSIEILFIFVTSFFSSFIKNKKENTSLPFKPELFWKIINFTEILEKYFTNDYTNKNQLIISFFDLLENFFISIKDSNTTSIYFKKLLSFCLGNFQNNLIITYNFLYFMYEMQWKGYIFDDEDILLLLNFSSKFYIDNADNNNSQNINNKLIDDLFSVISWILVNRIFIKDSPIYMDKINEKIKIFSNNQNILLNIINEIMNIIEGVMNNKNKFNFYIKNISNYMKFYWNIFNFIINLFKNLISEKDINIEEELNENKEKKKIYKLKNNINYLNVYSLLPNIEKIIREKKDKNSANINCIYCLINFIKFYHYIIFNEKNILKFSEKAFVDNLLQVINLCLKHYHLVNFNQSFKVIINDCEYFKTIIEIITEIYMQYFLNDINSDSNCSNKLLKSQYIFYDNEFDKDKQYTIFFVNDYLRLLSNKKKINEKEKMIIEKYKILNNYNEIKLKNEKKVNDNFTTLFLLKIGGYQNLLENNKNLDNSFVLELKTIFNKLFDNILKEHLDLAELSKDFFFSNSNSSYNYYNQLIQLLKSKYIKKKKNSIEEIKKFFENNKQFLSDNIYKISFSGLISNDKKENEKENNNALNEKDENSFLKEKNKEIKIEKIKFPKNIGNIIYLNDIDKLLLKNPKKEIMNNIFSLYYIDIFYYNEAFCKMRDYYINKFKSTNPFTKVIDFPSKLKNYSNNLESPLFIKQYNEYFFNPIFPIIHSYINDNNKKIIENYKYIKLFPKQIPIIKEEITNIFYCELIKTDGEFFGKIFQNDSSEYLLFNEEDININVYEESYKYIFLLSFYNTVEQKKNSFMKGKEKYRVKKNKKSILILYDEIEEIVERRVFLLWKAVEIYLKNGKSYLFNFLNTSKYENFINSFTNKNKIKNLIKNKDFLSDEKNISSEWKKGLINTYEYILLLNKFSSRSFNDPSQYPIFPWLLNRHVNLKNFNENINHIEEALKEHIIAKNENNELFNNKNYKTNTTNIKNIQYENILKKAKDQIRHFNYPPSIQKAEKKKSVMNKYIDFEENGEFPYHNGSHYSTSAYIFFYLMRMQPFSNLLVRLQGYNLENPNRCFISITSVEDIISSGQENRELIPELFSKMEYFLNLNCIFFGYLQGSEVNVDDTLIDIFPGYKENTKNPLSIYVYFILEHKKLLNSKFIGYYINKWIDNIFGVNQFPHEKLRKNSFNIFHKYSYEQKINLENKLNKLISKNKLNEKKIKEKINIIINYMVNFGQAPYQIFQIPHPKIKINIKKEIVDFFGKKNDNNTDKVEENEEEYDFESLISNSIRNQDLDMPIEGNPLYFQINPSINKMFIYNYQGKIIIFNCELFNKTDSSYYQITNIFTIKKSNIFLYGLINEKSKYLIYKLKYSFNSFDYNDNLKDNEIFHTNYSDILKEIKQKEKLLDKIKDNTKSKKDKYANEIFEIITCRHIDFSYKIYCIKRKNKKDIIDKVFSFVCEDFVTSCCTISSKQFLLGLRNGKLILCTMNCILKIDDDKNNKSNKNKVDSFIVEDIKIKYERYIQGHHGKINVIEVDKRIGVIITSGDDNYILIRKLYDFELLLPIKIKSKYIVQMAKISSFNFLYVLCFNKIKNQTVIFGYTLSGLNFAKSEYGLYDNISFTGNGNIVTMNNKKEVLVLSGSDLSRINMSEDEESMKIINELKGTNWMQFDCFLRRFEEDISKIITFFHQENNNIHVIKTLNVRKIKYFD